jgi:hypothetical protein
VRPRLTWNARISQSNPWTSTRIRARRSPSLVIVVLPGLVQCWCCVSTGWTLTNRLRETHGVMPPRPPLTVTKLSDHFGQYVLILTCECGHKHTAQPRTLAGWAGGTCCSQTCSSGCGALNVVSADARQQFDLKRSATADGLRQHARVGRECVSMHSHGAADE